MRANVGRVDGLLALALSLLVVQRTRPWRSCTNALAMLLGGELLGVLAEGAVTAHSPVRGTRRHTGEGVGGLT